MDVDGRVQINSHFSSVSPNSPRQSSCVVAVVRHEGLPGAVPVVPACVEPRPLVALLSYLALLADLVLKSGHPLHSDAWDIGHHEACRAITDWGLASRE